MMIAVEPPVIRPLGPDEVHVWRVPLDGSGADAPRVASPCADEPFLDGASGLDAMNVLSPDERERAARFALPRLRTRWVAARSALRLILGAYTGRPAASLVFDAGPRGKPSLRVPEGSPGGAEPALHFNLAHSDDLALIALTTVGAVGVDVERLRPVRDAEAIARRYFSPEECADLARVPSSDYDYAFLSCWTRKEALLKASGEGLALPLDRFRVSLAPGTPARLLSVAGDEAAARPWWLAHLDPAPGFVGAVGIRLPVASVVGYRFSVLGSRLSVIGYRFSVFGSRFSVMSFEF